MPVLKLYYLRLQFHRIITLQNSSHIHFRPVLQNTSLWWRNAVKVVSHKCTSESSDQHRQAESSICLEIREYHTAYTEQELAYCGILCCHTSTRQAMCVPRNIAARSRNHGSLGKAIHIEYHGCTYFCLSYLHAKHIFWAVLYSAFGKSLCT
jgi:hypothetical protein